jgi:glycerophosphoryl diester phosphodiesterase
MNNKKRSKLVAIGLGIVTMLTMSSAYSEAPLVIAHRGASGYLPEHTIAAKAMAYAMGADYIEQDVVMTKDNHLVVLHDHFLDEVTDVQTKFKDRKRPDGRYYVIDFTLDEIRTLNVSERYSIKAGHKVPVFPDRFPLNESRFRVHTLSEEIELIQGLNKSTGKSVGLYTEVKSPSFHLEEGKDLSLEVLKILKAYGYIKKSDKAYFQSFEIGDLNRVATKLLPALNMEVKLVQLMNENEYYDAILTKQGILDLAQYVDGIGPSLGMIVDNNSLAEKLKISRLVSDAHAAGLVVHPYTFRREAGAIPAYASSYEHLLDIFLNRAKVDGLFTDFTDLTVQFVKKNTVVN